MINQIIKFHSNKMYNKKNDFHPVPSKLSFPKWFSKANKVWKFKDGTILKDMFGDDALSFKHCPALMDGFVSGYTLLTPCDIYFYKIGDKTKCYLPEEYKDFCEPREAMDEFVVPYGYSDDHFHWYPNWSAELPEGYSALYINPINRYDLPFITTSGIIDSDNMTTSGFTPFFLKEGFTGTVPAGTPYIQIFPIKRDNWVMEKIFHDESSIQKRVSDSGNIFRIKGGGGYRDKMWEKKNFS